jgi:hypothetical protein
VMMQTERVMRGSIAGGQTAGHPPELVIRAVHH